MLFCHLPKPLYEGLPAVYVLGGLSSAFWSDNLMGVAAGVLLAVAGLHVRLVRKRYRADQIQHRARIDARLRRARRSEAH